VPGPAHRSRLLAQYVFCDETLKEAQYGPENIQEAVKGKFFEVLLKLVLKSVLAQMITELEHARMNCDYCIFYVQVLLINRVETVNLGESLPEQRVESSPQLPLLLCIGDNPHGNIAFASQMGMIENASPLNLMFVRGLRTSERSSVLLKITLAVLYWPECSAILNA
jgi:hypothetical protein